MDNYKILDLNQDHKTLLTKFIQFFKSKKEKFIRDLKLDIDDHSQKK
jgi:hypothetical protein